VGNRPQVVVVEQTRHPPQVVVVAQTRHPSQVVVVEQTRHPPQVVVVEHTRPLAVNQLAGRLVSRLVPSSVSVVSVGISFVIAVYILRGIGVISVCSGHVLVPSAVALVSDTYGILWHTR